MLIKMSHTEVSISPEQTPTCHIKVESAQLDDTTVASLDSGVLLDKSINQFEIIAKRDGEGDTHPHSTDSDDLSPMKESVYDAVLGANDQELAKRQYVDDDADDDDNPYECLPKVKRLATSSIVSQEDPTSVHKENSPMRTISQNEKTSGDHNESSGPTNADSDNSESIKQSDEPEQLRKLFIGGLDWKTSEETLRKHFEKFGDVIDCVVMRDPQTKRSRGFGFVIYAKSSMVDRAQESRPHEVDGREVQPKRAISREDSGKPEAEATVKKVYLGGLSDDIEESELRDYFKEFGNIVNINIVAHKDTGKRRGFAFVEYDDWDPVDKIVLKKFHTIKDKRVEAKKAIPKVEMDARKRVDPRSAMSSSMMSLAAGVGGGPPSSALEGAGRAGRGGSRGMGPSYLWDAPYGIHQGNWVVGPDGYPPPYHSASAHYGGGWMAHGANQGGPYGFRGSHSGLYGGRNGYSSQAAAVAAAAAAAAAASGWPDYGGFSPTVASQGAGPMRHLANYQHRSYRPYANGNGYGLGGGSSTPRGGRGYNP